ncbi:MAG: hypothetical protein QMD09_05665 [Desulfatibacillaceae bacterium]|nr:hypothetical protein [Desulfatibacillaceae bacterium]
MKLAPVKFFIAQDIGRLDLPGKLLLAIIALSIKQNRPDCHRQPDLTFLKQNS